MHGCTGTRVHHAQTLRERVGVARPGRREQDAASVDGPGARCGECSTLRKLSSVRRNNKKKGTSGQALLQKHPALSHCRINAQQLLLVDVTHVVTELPPTAAAAAAVVVQAASAADGRTATSAPTQTTSSWWNIVRSSSNEVSSRNNSGAPNPEPPRERLALRLPGRAACRCTTPARTACNTEYAVSGRERMRRRAR